MKRSLRGGWEGQTGLAGLRLTVGSQPVLYTPAPAAEGACPGFRPLSISAPDSPALREWTRPLPSKEEIDNLLEPYSRKADEFHLKSNDPLAGVGSSAYVVQTEFRGRAVAAKVFRGAPNVDKYFRNELRVLAQLGTHENIIGFYGFTSAPTVILMEFGDYGSLFDVLHHERDVCTRRGVVSLEAPQISPDTVPGPNAVLAKAKEDGSVSFATLREAVIFHRTRMCVGIAKGMAHLHRFNYTHMDLTSRNILITKDFEAKICDFGLSVLMGDDGTAPRKHGYAPTYWKAPELCSKGRLVPPQPGESAEAEVEEEGSPVFKRPRTPGRRSRERGTPEKMPEKGGEEEPVSFSSKVDVFSYGMILWELWHPGVFPWNGDIAPGMRLVRGERPAIDAGCPPEWRFLITLCWQQRPEDRPHSYDVLQWLRQAYPEYTD